MTFKALALGGRHILHSRATPKADRHWLLPKHNRVMIGGRLSNCRRTAYTAAIIGRGFAQAPMAERPVELPPENQGADGHATSIPTSTAAVR
jgi:hypothetical protein